MAAIATVNGIEGLRELQGKAVGPSEWREVTQEMINTFAELSGDDQWIHVDVERAKKESPFGQTIAHGFLTLSLLPAMKRDPDWLLTGFGNATNYGANKLRFVSFLPRSVRLGSVPFPPNGALLIAPLLLVVFQQPSTPHLLQHAFLTPLLEAIVHRAGSPQTTGQGFTLATCAEHVENSCHRLPVVHLWPFRLLLGLRWR